MSDIEAGESRGRTLRPKRVAFYVFGVITTALSICWLVLAWSSVTVTDARVVADVITVRSQVNGVVTRVVAEEGRQYGAGALLVEMDSRLASEEVAEKEAKLRALSSSWEQSRIKEESSFRTARIGETDAELGVSTAEIGRLAADVRLGQSRNTSARSERLAADGLVPRISAELDRDSYELARLQANEAAAAKARQINALRRAQLGEMEARSASQGAKSAEGMVREARATLEIAKLVLSRYRVCAPQVGVIGKLLVRPGDSVIEGQRLLLQFDPRTLRVEARVSERDLTHFAVGKRVWVSLDASGGAKFSGIVRAVGALSESASSEWPQQPDQGNFVRVAQKVPVQIAIVASGKRLIPGTLAKVIVHRR